MEKQEVRKAYVAYYRVSTKGQGQSGLGLDAQREAVRRRLGGDGELCAEYTEVESGKKNNRPELAKAIEEAKRRCATLVIAKLDRLSRSAAFIFALRDSGVAILCCDLPELNTLTLGIFATLAQYERELISERTSAALQAKKRQGAKLGKPENLSQEARETGAAKRHEEFVSRYGKIRSLIKEYRRKGFSTRKIATRLSDLGFRTAQGRPLTCVHVHRILKSA